MKTFTLTAQQAETLTDFAREHDHAGPVRLSSDPSNTAGLVVRAELLAGDGTVIEDRLLHYHGSYTP
jgi:hypothetical protein